MISFPKMSPDVNIGASLISFVCKNRVRTPTNMFSKANDVDKEGKNFSCWNWISRVLYTIRYAIYLVQTNA